MARLFAIALLMLMILPTTTWADAEADAIRARDDRIEDLEQKMGLMIDELSRLRTQVAVPEETELKSFYGLGPAASKVYGLERGLSIGGYGEGFYTNFIGDEADTDRDRADFLRFVMYLGYKFSDKIVFNSEIEFEHASTDKAGSASVELASLDFFWKPELNFRAGLMLLPMGFINEIHEPPFFYGVQRPEVERRILPSTWRENGVGIFGQFGESFEYRSYLVTGFDATGFSDSGIRGGRQKGSKALAEDFAWVTRFDYSPEILPGLQVGGSLYFGDSGQDQETGVGDVPDARLWLGEAHVQYRKGPFHSRALLAYSQLSDARDLNLALGRPKNKPIADKMLGAYAEVAYDIWPMLFGNEQKALEPFLRVEYVDTQYEVPSGYSANRQRAYWVYTPGINLYLHPNVVLKLEYRNFNAQDGTLPDELSLGMGFAF
ncbi:MAG: hypothetical protein JRG95_13860 [Deltaproteobacteria bacterium]|nr:hypothetical protein [Deltaproteobacteria bacterium]